MLKIYIHATTSTLSVLFCFEVGKTSKCKTNEEGNSEKINKSEKVLEVGMFSLGYQSASLSF